MNRTIQFRARRTDNGQWAYGSLLTRGDRAAITNLSVSTTIIDVDEKTIGQYTGLRDLDGTPIYEGDIVRWNRDGLCYVVKFWRGMFYASVEELNPGTLGGYPLWGFQPNPDETYGCRITGNIHNKPNPTDPTDK